MESTQGQNISESGSQQPPPPAPAAGPPPAGAGSSTKKVLAIALVITVLIVLVVVALVLMGSSGPEDVCDNLMDSIKSGDMESALDNDVISLHEDYDQIKTDMIGNSETPPEDFKAKQKSVTYLDDMADSEKKDAEHAIDIVEQEIGVTVDDYCAVQYEITQDGETQTVDIPCVQVDGDWYTAIYVIGVIENEDDDTPVVAFTFEECIIFGDNYSFEIKHISGEDLDLSQVTLTLEQGGDSYDVAFYEGTLSAGDKIFLLSEDGGSTWTVKVGASGQTAGEINADTSDLEGAVLSESQMIRLRLEWDPSGKLIASLDKKPESP